jgi:hypothetical protein
MVPARGAARLGIAFKQFTVFVDNVVGNPPGPARLRRIHAVVSGLLKISSSEDSAGLAARQNPDARNLHANSGDRQSVGETRQFIKA